jgi:MoxR-like ATPase
MRIIDETRSDNRLYMGVSPRGSLALYRGAQALAAIRGRDYVVPEDVKEMSYPILNKRLLIKSEFTSKGTTENAVIGQLLDKIEVPGYKDAV